MTPVLRYFKNSYRKKNKHRYSVWTGIPPSSSRYPTRRGSSQDRLLIKMNEREQMASSQLETAQWLERLENRRDMNFSLSLYIPVEPLDPKVWPRFMSLFLMMVSEADRSHVLNVSLLRLHRLFFLNKKIIINQTNSKQYLMNLGIVVSFI